MQYFLILSLLVSSAFAANRSYKVTVFAEPGAEEGAREFSRKLITLEPFKQLHEKGLFVINEEPVSAKKTRCQGGYYGIPRLAQCNTSSIKNACKGSELCPIFTNVPFIGAGGDPFPISSSTFPWTTMLHEFIHTFGFSDEYAYTKSETPTYCGSLVNNPNEIQLSSAQNFLSKKDAEEACVKLIPWCAEALREGNEVVTEVNGRFLIGSPLPESCPSNQLGVYLGAGCMKARPESTYRPYFCPTVMGFPTIGQDYCEVQERHDIIVNSPNLIPTYYQRVLFEKIIDRIGARGVEFEARAVSLPERHLYGIPGVDELIIRPEEVKNKCSKKQE